MKLYFKLTIFILIILPSHGFSQDPSCDFVITLENVQDNTYEYKTIIEYDYEKEDIDSIKEKIKTNWENKNWILMENTLLKSNSNNKILVSYLSDYCYPNQNIENQLRIIIARRKKGTNIIKLMYGMCKLIPHRTEIIIKKFKSGQRQCEIFEYKKDSLNNENVDYDHNQYLSLKSRKIYLK